MSINKIKARGALKKLIDAHKKSGKRIAFTNGCFDILHYGHVKYLEDAKKAADFLVVALNSDNSVKLLKGKRRPIVSLKDRMRVVASLESVDYVTYFDEATPAKIISYLRPHLVIKGGDYKVKDIVGNDMVKAYGGSVKTVPFEKGYSATSLIKRITGRYGKYRK